MTDREAPFEALKLEHQLCFPLYAVSRLVIQCYEPMLKELGLTYPQYIVMLALWEADGVNVSQLCKKLYLDSGTVTPVLQKLQKAGLVRRSRDPNDDRIVLNHLTPAGWDLRPKALHLMQALFCGSRISLEEVLPLRESVNDLIARLLAWREK